MNSKQFTILKTIFFNTTDKRFCTIKAESIKQGKKFYRRVKELEDNGFIIVIREPGEPNLYRLTDSGMKQMIEHTPYSQIV